MAIFRVWSVRCFWQSKSPIFLGASASAGPADPGSGDFPADQQGPLVRVSGISSRIAAVQPGNSPGPRADPADASVIRDGLPIRVALSEVVYVVNGEMSKWSGRGNR